MAQEEEPQHDRLPAWAPAVGVVAVLALAWINFLTTSRWAGEPGALHGWRKPWYGLALALMTMLVLVTWRRIGRPIRLPRSIALPLLAAGAAVLLASLFGRLPLSSWTQIPFKDDWTPLFQHAVNGVGLLRRGVVVGWNWYFLGGYPTSTDIAQNFSTLAFVPMTLFGDRLGYHVLHAVLFLAVPIFVWSDLCTEEPDTRILATALACVTAAGYFGTIGSSGDTNSLAGVFSAGLAIVGGHAARRGAIWGGALLLAGLTLALYTHTAFFGYAGIFLALEAAYFRDLGAFWRLIAAAAFAGAAALPVHWESLRHPEYVSFNNTVYEPGAPIRWGAVARTIYYNVEILLLPHRWFNDYRSLANVWLPALIVAAVTRPASRVGFYALAAVLTQALLRVNTPTVGAIFDRIQHMLPLLVAPALAGFILRRAGSLPLALAMTLVAGLFVQTSFAPVRHVETLRDFDPPLIDRIASADGMVLVEISPHRDMDASPTRRTPTTPFDVHFEGLLPSLGGQRFYSQMIDGWVWNRFRGQVVGAGTFAGQLIDLTPGTAFEAEMRRWGVRHLFVWTDISRNYLARNDHFTECWRGGRWSQFVLADADVRSVVTRTGAGTLARLDFLGADVTLTGVTAGDPVLVRANYYPAWRAAVDGTDVPLYSAGGQMAFLAPRNGDYVVRLEYPRYRMLSLLALLSLAAGGLYLTRHSRRAPVGHPRSG
jgi:hypothetical protein